VNKINEQANTISLMMIHNLPSGKLTIIISKTID